MSFIDESGAKNVGEKDQIVIPARA
ncbi:MAG: transcriptional regulator, partial [Streptococcus mutans]